MALPSASTLATAIWTEAWSLALMILLVAEHFLGMYNSTYTRYVRNKPRVSIHSNQTVLMSSGTVAFFYMYFGTIAEFPFLFFGWCIISVLVCASTPM